MKTISTSLLITLISLCHSPTHAETAVEAWVQRYNGPTESDDQAQKTVVDSSGNIIVAGFNVAGITGNDWLIIKYSNAGVLLWTNRYNGPGNGDDRATAVAVNASGDVFVTGTSLGIGSDLDYATIKYSGEGVPLWTNRYNGPGNIDDQAQGVAVDGSGNVFVTGHSHDGASYDYATVGYSGAGAPLWTNRYNGQGSFIDQANAVAVDSSGNVFVTGRSWSGSTDDYATIGYSVAGVPLWTNRYNGPGNSADYAYAVAVDGSGNVFVTGYSIGSVNPDYATIAYSGAGVPLWTNRYSGPGYDTAYAVAVDGSGNVLVTGSSEGNIGGDDYATIKYSGAGVAMWTNRYNRSLNDQATAVAVDGSGNVFVTGSSESFALNYDYATIKYSAAGVPLWTNRYAGPGSSTETAQAVAVDGSGNVFVTGRAGGSSFSGSIKPYDYATIKYSGAGVPLWTNLYNEPRNSSDAANAVAVDGSGNVIVTGNSTGTNNGYSDYATVKYSSAGVPLWTNRYNGPGNGDDFARAMAVDSTGNVFVTGQSSGYGGINDYDFVTLAYSGTGALVWTNRYSVLANGADSTTAIVLDGNGNVFVTGSSYGSASGYDYATIGYSNTGLPLWTNRYNGPAGSGNDQPTAIAVDGSGNVFVTGSAYVSGFNNYDYATIKYSGAGVPLWTNRYNGPGNDEDRAKALAVDASGNVFVTGGSAGSGLNYDYATIKYSGAGVPLWTNRYNGPGNSGDGAEAVAVDGSGNVLVTGYSTGGGSSYDYATIKYSGSGARLWTNRYNGPGNGSDEAYAIAVAGNGNVFVTGQSVGSGSSYDYATIEYSGAGVPLWTNRYNGSANGNDSPGGKQSLALGADGSVHVTGSSDGDYATVKYIVLVSPVITVQPASRTNLVGTAATFAVTATGSAPLSHQWWSNGVSISGATATNYTIANVQMPDATNYSVVITNVAGSVTSSIAILTVVPNSPPIVANPISDTNGVYGSAFDFTFAENTFSDPDAGQVLSYTAGGLPPGITFTGATRTFSGTPSNTGPYSVTVTATDNGTPVLNTNNVFNLVVDKAPLTATADNQSRGYGETNPPLSFSYSGFVLGETSTVLDTPPTASTTATNGSPVGNHPITLGGGADDHYSFSYSNGTLTITAAPLTVTANNANRVQGAPDPALTGSLVGVTDSDDITATFSTTAIPSSPPGDYLITPILQDPNSRLSNYTVTTNNGILTVSGVTLELGGSAGSATICWPTNAAAFLLEFTDDMTPPVIWQSVTSGITTNAPNICLTVAPELAVPSLFYRLRLP